MMISGGGQGGGAGAKAAEVLSLSDDLPLLYPINIPDLPEDRDFHTMNNNIICGGKHSTTCIKLTRDWGASFTWFYSFSIIVKLRRGSGKDRQGMALKVKGLKA